MAHQRTQRRSRNAQTPSLYFEIPDEKTRSDYRRETPEIKFALAGRPLKIGGLALIAKQNTRVRHTRESGYPGAEVAE
jgi:hypothetical protein